MACIDFDAIDYIDEISTTQLDHELESRRNGGDNEAYTDRSWREWVLLADFIAEGRKGEALDLLSRIAPSKSIRQRRSVVCR